MDNFERMIRQECSAEKQYNEHSDYEAVEMAEKAIAAMFSNEPAVTIYKTKKYKTRRYSRYEPN